MPQVNLENLLRAGLERLGLPLDEANAGRVLAYVGLLEKWNRAYNLTAVREPAEMVVRHILDSLAILPWVPGGSLLDVGAGAGLPGIPLAIANPGLDVTLVDSAGKKVRFMNHARRELGLENVHPAHSRIEDFSSLEPFDGIVSRAFTRLSDFAAAVRHLAGGNTRLLAMKGRYPEQEAAELPGWARVRSIEKLFVPGLHEHRHLVIMSVIP